MPLLALSGVTKTFGGLTAVKALSFAVEEGEIVGLIGPNGSGKTTVFNLITGFLAPDGGDLTFAGRRLVGLKPHQICRLGVGRTFQLVQPFHRLSVLDNVRVGAFRGTADPRQATAVAEAILEEVGLAAKKAFLPPSLTLAERKRLELARALATGPRLLLLDEVMAGLTPTETAEMIAFIRRLHRRGLTLLIIEHVMQAVMALSQRLVVLHHGEKICEGPPQEVARDPQVIRAYLGEEAASA
ncbi:MAG: ABC transporter ATP-binding protein [Candidatus Tectimicrobiota bacterium]|nr:MAG: ABC transporter ATP-binding protein [Candidatus Tectomicrobia bacterium]